MPSGGMESGYCRLTVLAPRTRLDVALPVDVPVAELVPMVLELVGEPGPTAPARPWRLSGIGGGPLPAGRSLRELAVLDGELLRIAPAGPPPAAPVFDDPVDAVAATAGAAQRHGRWFRAAAAGVSVAAAVVLLTGPPDPVGSASMLVNAWTGADGRDGTAALVAGIAAAVALLVAGLAVWWTPTPTPGRDDRPPATEPHRTDATAAADLERPPLLPRPTAAGVAVACAVALAAVAGATLVPGQSGAVRLLAGAAATATAAAIGLLVLRTTVPALVAIAVAALPVGLGALVTLRWGVPVTATAAGVGTAALVVAPLAPRAALWLAGLPRPVVPANAGELAGADRAADQPGPAELAERARSARRLLAGLTGAAAITTSGAALVAAAGPGWAGPGFAAVTVALLGLRARSFVDPGPAGSLAGAALATTVGAAVILGGAAAPPQRLAVSIVLLAAALLAVVALDRPATPGSPVRRRMTDLGEAALTAAVVPLGLAAMDAYALVRGL